MEGRRFSQEKLMILPGQLYKIAAVAQKVKPEATIEIDRALDVPHQNFGNELFRRVNVSIHSLFVANVILDAYYL